MKKTTLDPNLEESGSSEEDEQPDRMPTVYQNYRSPAQKVIKKEVEEEENEEKLDLTFGNAVPLRKRGRTRKNSGPPVKKEAQSPEPSCRTPAIQILRRSSRKNNGLIIKKEEKSPEPIRQEHQSPRRSQRIMDAISRKSMKATNGERRLPLKTPKKEQAVPKRPKNEEAEEEAVSPANLPHKRGPARSPKKHVAEGLPGSLPQAISGTPEELNKVERRCGRPRKKAAANGGRASSHHESREAGQAKKAAPAPVTSVNENDISNGRSSELTRVRHEEDTSSGPDVPPAAPENAVPVYEGNPERHPTASNEPTYSAPEAVNEVGEPTETEADSSSTPLELWTSFSFTVGVSRSVERGSSEFCTENWLRGGIFDITDYEDVISDMVVFRHEERRKELYEEDGLLDPIDLPNNEKIRRSPLTEITLNELRAQEDSTAAGDATIENEHPEDCSAPPPKKMKPLPTKLKPSQRNSMLSQSNKMGEDKKRDTVNGNSDDNNRETVKVTLEGHNHPERNSQIFPEEVIRDRVIEEVILTNETLGAAISPTGSSTRNLPPSSKVPKKKAINNFFADVYEQIKMADQSSETTRKMEREKIEWNEALRREREIRMSRNIALKKSNAAIKSAERTERERKMKMGRIVGTGFRPGQANQKKERKQAIAVPPECQIDTSRIDSAIARKKALSSRSPSPMPTAPGEVRGPIRKKYPSFTPTPDVNPMFSEPRPKRSDKDAPILKHNILRHRSISDVIAAGQAPSRPATVPSLGRTPAAAQIAVDAESRAPAPEVAADHTTSSEQITSTSQVRARAGLDPKRCAPPSNEPGPERQITQHPVQLPRVRPALVRPNPVYMPSEPGAPLRRLHYGSDSESSSFVSATVVALASASQGPAPHVQRSVSTADPIEKPNGAVPYLPLEKPAKHSAPSEHCTSKTEPAGKKVKDPRSPGQ